ncbi:unnamed protein product, partial [Heterosigma akashiwo]
MIAKIESMILHRGCCNKCCKCVPCIVTAASTRHITANTGSKICCSLCIINRVLVPITVVAAQRRRPAPCVRVGLQPKAARILCGRRRRGEGARVAAGAPAVDAAPGGARRAARGLLPRRGGRGRRGRGR